MSTVSVQDHSPPLADRATRAGFRWFTYCNLDGVAFGLGPTPQAAAEAVEHDIRQCYTEPPDDGDIDGAVRREAALALNGCLVGGGASDEPSAFTVWARVTRRGLDAAALAAWRAAFPQPEGGTDPLVEVVEARRARVSA